MELLEFFILLIVNVVLLFFSVSRRGFFYSLLGMFLSLLCIPLVLGGVVMERVYVLNNTSGEIQLVNVITANSTFTVLLLAIFVVLHALVIVKYAKI